MWDEIDRLRAEVERLRAGGCARNQTTTQYCAEAARLAAENEKLRAEVQKLESECTDLATDLSTQRQDNASLSEPWKVVNPLQAEAARLAAENQKLRARVDVLLSKNNALTELCNSALSSDDMKAVDKHCDWVAFGHAYRAMLNVRRARAELQDESDE
jgi:cell division protein FtsB